MMLRERELEAQDHGRKNEILYFLHSLVENNSMDPDYLKEFMQKRKLSFSDSYRLVVINVVSHDIHTNLSMVEEHAYRVFEQIPGSLYIFNYPKEFWLMVEAKSFEKNLMQYENLTLEILLGNLDEDAKERYKKRTIERLSQEDLHLLATYFASNLSLQTTAETLFIHKNTVQYKLNRIHHLTGLNPRVFEDAVVLYLAGHLG